MIFPWMLGDKRLPFKKPLGAQFRQKIRQKFSA
jgi:hypothetical protein